MRQNISKLWLLCLCLILPLSLRAAVFTTPVENPFSHHNQIDARYLQIGRTDFNDDAFKHEKISLRQWSVEASHLHCIAPGTGVGLSVAYYDTNFHWINSPFFTQRRYPEVQIMVGGVTCALQRWIWRGAFGISQQTQRFSFGRYGVYRGFLWGRYAVCPKIGAHVGALFCSGLKSTFVLPILGIDWQVKPNFRIEAVFPLDVVAKLYLARDFSVGIGGRWLRARFRAGQDNPLPEGLFEFRTWGVEGRLTYKFGCRFGIDVFGGSTIWGWTRVQNPTGGRITFRNTLGAPYGGVEAYLRF